MFSGLVQEVSLVLKAERQSEILKLTLKKPDSFVDLKEGESIAVNGVCLTLVHFDENSICFDLGPETLKITGWTCSNLKNKRLNLERSLSLQSALGGQILTGHVDEKALVKKIEKQTESLVLTVQIPPLFKKFVYPKGYLALNGVSLTVNQVKGLEIDFCLIPETLKRTNLSDVKAGDFLNFEVDYISRPMIQLLENQHKRFFALLLIFLLLLLSTLLICFILLWIS